MKLKLDEYTANIIIKGLYNYQTGFDENTFKNFYELVLYLINKSKDLFIKKYQIFIPFSHSN